MSESIDCLIKQEFTKAQNILITTHIRPDGDAIGSMLGLGLSLENAGKSVQMYLANDIPSTFHYLYGFDQIIQQPDNHYDLSIILDSGEISRVGNYFSNITPDINIDHHATNLRYARINLIETNAPSTTAILADHMPSWGLNINQQSACALLSGLISDTIGFRTPNVTPQTLRLAASLMEKGVDLSSIYNDALVRRSYEGIQYWALGLYRLQIQGRMVWTSLTLDDRIKAGYPGNDDADLINILSAIDSADIAVIFVEQKNFHVKVSWRTNPGFDVSEIAVKFNGGGHPAAAGADIPGKLEIVQNQVLEATRHYLTNHAFVKGKLSIITE